MALRSPPWMTNAHSPTTDAIGSCMKSCWKRSISRSSCGYLARTSHAKPPPFENGRSFKSRCEEGCSQHENSGATPTIVTCVEYCFARTPVLELCFCVSVNVIARPSHAKPPPFENGRAFKSRCEEGSVYKHRAHEHTRTGC